MNFLALLLGRAAPQCFQFGAVVPIRAPWFACGSTWGRSWAKSWPLGGRIGRSRCPWACWRFTAWPAWYNAPRPLGGGSPWGSRFLELHQFARCHRLTHGAGPWPCGRGGRIPSHWFTNQFQRWSWRATVGFTATGLGWCSRSDNWCAWSLWGRGALRRCGTHGYRWTVLITTPGGCLTGATGLRFARCGCGPCWF